MKWKQTAQFDLKTFKQFYCNSNRCGWKHQSGRRLCLICQNKTLVHKIQHKMKQIATVILAHCERDGLCLICKTETLVQQIKGHKIREAQSTLAWKKTNKIVELSCFNHKIKYERTCFILINIIIISITTLHICPWTGAVASDCVLSSLERGILHKNARPQLHLGHHRPWARFPGRHLLTDT